MDMKTKIFSIVLIAGCIGSFMYGRSTVKPEIKEVNTVDTVIEERIVEKPGGERVVYRKVKEKKASTKTKTTKKDWIVSLTQTSFDGPGNDAIYGLQVSKRMWGSAHFGLYARTDSETGLVFSYQF